MKESKKTKKEKASLEPQTERRDNERDHRRNSNNTPHENDHTQELQIRSSCM